MPPGCEVPIDREEIQSVPLDRILLCPAEAYLRESFADILMICCRPCDLLCRFSADDEGLRCHLVLTMDPNLQIGISLLGQFQQRKNGFRC